MFLIVVLTTLTLSVLRVLGWKSKSFQAFAHLFVGGLIGAWLGGASAVFLTFAVVMSIVELFCFIALPRE
jgi:hypothetical protein